MAFIEIPRKPRQVEISQALSEVLYLHCEGDVDAVAKYFKRSPQAIYKIVAQGRVETRRMADAWAKLSRLKGPAVPSVEFIYPEYWQGPSRWPDALRTPGGGGRGPSKGRTPRGERDTAALASAQRLPKTGSSAIKLYTFLYQPTRQVLHGTKRANGR